MTRSRPLMRYELRKDPVSGFDPELPEDPGTVHAFSESKSVELFAGTPRYATQYDSWDAVCGRRVKVLLTQRFDTVDPSARESCVRVLSAPEGTE
jgi:hypothetical protein